MIHEYYLKQFHVCCQWDDNLHITNVLFTSKHCHLSFAFILVMFYLKKQTSKHCHAPFVYNHVHFFGVNIIISCNHLIIESKPWNKMSCIWSKIKTKWRERSNGREIQNNKMNVQCRSYKINPLILNKNKESMVCMYPQPRLILFFRVYKCFQELDNWDWVHSTMLGCWIQEEWKLLRNK